MKILLTGGSGFIGKSLAEKLTADQHSVVILTRNPDKTREMRGVSVKHWDAKNVGDWASEVDGADAVLNFAGESIGGKRWTARQKENIIESRHNATRALVEAIRQARRKPSVLISASGVGYYGHVEQEEVTESHPRGEGFLPEVCERWENEAKAAEQFGVRVVRLRQGVVLERDGGALPRMSLPFKMFVGGYLGSGAQWFPWIHRADLVGIVRFVLAHGALSGPVNVVAPEARTMKEFCAALGRALKRPLWAPVPSFVLKAALGEMSEMLLTGQRVVPAKLVQAGYQFKFSKLDDALSDIFL
jgi:hypothetical protein